SATPFAYQGRPRLATGTVGRAIRPRTGFLAACRAFPYGCSAMSARRVARFSPLREELRRAFFELRGGRLSPARGAAAVALGFFVGCQPIFGCHLPVIVVVCLWLRLDALVAYVAANISNPLVAPALLTAEVQVGAFVRTGERLRFEHTLTRAGAF